MFSYNAGMRPILFLLCVAFLLAAGGFVSAGMAMGLVAFFGLGAFIAWLVLNPFFKRQQ